MRWLVLVVSACGAPPIVATRAAPAAVVAAVDPVVPVAVTPVIELPEFVADAPYAALFDRGWVWKLNVRAVRDGAWETAAATCRVAGVRVLADAVVSLVTCDGMPDNCRYANPASTYIARAGGMWSIEGLVLADAAGETELADADVVLARPARALGREDFAAKQVDGDWCATWKFTTSPLGERTLCVGARGIVTASALMRTTKRVKPSTWACAMATAP